MERWSLETPATGAEEKRELLSFHETVAVLKGIEFRLCRGLTTRCPKDCGHSGQFANFAIKKYLKYEKPAQFGDPQQKEFVIQVSDYYKKPVGDPKILETVGKLKAGDYVLLTWRHEYVSMQGASNPERPIVKIERIEPAKAAELLRGK